MFSPILFQSIQENCVANGSLDIFHYFTTFVLYFNWAIHYLYLKELKLVYPNSLKYDAKHHEN